MLRLVCEIFVIRFKNGFLLGWLGSRNCKKKNNNNYLPYLIHFVVILQHTCVATYYHCIICKKILVIVRSIYYMDLTITSIFFSRVTFQLDELKSIFFALHHMHHV